MSCTLGKEHVCCTRIEHLTVKAGNETILNDINLHLHCGELTAIIGRNGAGKTTFIKALLDVIPHSGDIIFEGEKCDSNCGKENTTDHSRFCSCRSTHGFTTRKPRFGYVPQSLTIESSSPVSVEDVVLSSISKWPVWLPPRKKHIEKALEILRSTNAHSLLKRKIGNLSGGELQRVMLALAINPVPDILLLDEPVSGVDRVGLKGFYQLVSSLRRDYDITILLVSHDLDLVAKHADRVLFINNQSAASGTVEQIYSSPEFTEVFGKIDVASIKSGSSTFEE
ncbi:MAG: metal ABC transporter ATP-binding protein [Spirochaetia bacterium]|nr:metal ABC transporter ATP-binding protein [Spirochaetia bacterium]